MNDDAVTWTEVMIIALVVIFAWAFSRASKRITALEDGAKKKAGAVSGDS